MVSDLTFLHSGHQPRCVASVDKHFTYHTLQLMTQGSIRLYYDEQAFDLQGRWLWPCHPGPHIRFHNWPRRQPWHHRYIAFTGPRVATWQAEGVWPLDQQAVTVEQVDGLAQQFDRLITLSRQPGRWSRLQAANLLESLLLERAATTRPRADMAASLPLWLKGVQEQLADLTVQQPNYQQIARRHNLSLTTLRRQFRQVTGMSLHQYHLDCRIAEARRLLGETDRTIKQIANDLDYQDVFYFSRQFRLRVGVPPAAYRRSRQT